MFWCVLTDITKYIIVVIWLILFRFQNSFSLCSFQTYFSSKFLLSFHFSSKLIWFLKEQELRLPLKFNSFTFIFGFLSFRPRNMHIFFILTIKFLLKSISLHFFIRLEKHRHHLYFFVLHRHKKILKLRNLRYILTSIQKNVIVLSFHMRFEMFSWIKILTVTHRTTIYFLGHHFALFLQFLF